MFMVITIQIFDEKYVDCFSQVFISVFIWGDDFTIFHLQRSFKKQWDLYSKTSNQFFKKIVYIFGICRFFVLELKKRMLLLLRKLWKHIHFTVETRILLLKCSVHLVKKFFFVCDWETFAVTLSIRQSFFLQAKPYK